MLTNIGRLQAKLNDIAIRREFKADFWETFRNAKEIPLSPSKTAGIAWNFGMNQSQLRVLECRVSSNCSICFVCRGLLPIEIVTYRGLRSLTAKWEKRYLTTVPIVVPELIRYREIFKYKNRRKIQGGLMKGQLSPRITGKSRLPIMQKLYASRQGVSHDSPTV